MLVFNIGKYVSLEKESYTMSNNIKSDIRDLFFDFRTDLDYATSLINIITNSISNQFDTNNKDMLNLILILKKHIEKLNIDFEKILNKSNLE